MRGTIGATGQIIKGWEEIYDLCERTWNLGDHGGQIQDPDTCITARRRQVLKNLGGKTILYTGKQKLDEGGYWERERVG